MMNLIALAVVATLAWQQPVPGVVMKFPHEFKPEYGERIHRLALESWPGPQGLIATWQSDRLREPQRVALLLGAAGFHDRQLLPVYQDAVRSESPTIRLAAVYGYRTLIGDPPPPTHLTINDEQVQLLLQEMQVMDRTLQRHSLVTMWLASALRSEDKVWPGWSGMLMNRPSHHCFQSIERVAEPEDLRLLLDAYPLFQKPENRISLLQLIEGMSLSRFIKKPQAGKAWGPKIYAEGERQLAFWLETHCRSSVEELLAERFTVLGISGVDPFHVDACVAWQEILAKGDSSWWWLAARMLYRCGAPPATLTITRADSEENQQQQERLLSWYGLMPPGAKHDRPQRQRKPRRPTNPFAGRK